MFKLALLFSCIIYLSSAKLTKFPDYPVFEFNNELFQPNFKRNLKSSDVSNSLWVLNLNDTFESVRLRVGTCDEEKDFDAIILPMSHRLKLRLTQKSSRIKKDDPLKYYKDSDKNDSTASRDFKQKDKEMKELRAEIMKIINKFVMSYADPDVYVYENESEKRSPSLALYFKGIFTSLIVKYGRKQWHYIISPPSLLPEWFYEEHENIIKNGKIAPIEIPETVKKEFYRALLHLLRIFLNFPV